MDYSEIEKKRKLFAAMLIGGISSLVIGLLIMMIVDDDAKDKVAIVSWILMILGGISAAISSVKFNKIKREFKTKVMPNLIKEVLGESFSYDPNRGLSSSDVFSTRIMHSKDTYSSEDLIVGEYDGVGVRTSDVHIQERHETHGKNGTEVTYVTTFLGRFIELTFQKFFDGVVVSAEETPIYRGLERCELEMIEYNKKYKTYANNEHNAFYLLTPPMLEALLRVEKKYKGRVGIEFEGNKVFVAINNNIDTFSLSLLKPVSEESLEQFREELRCITDLISEIRTNKIYRSE